MHQAGHGITPMAKGPNGELRTKEQEQQAMMRHYEGMYNQFHQGMQYLNYIRSSSAKEYLDLLLNATNGPIL